MSTFVVSTEIDGQRRHIELEHDGTAVHESHRVELYPTNDPGIWEWMDNGTSVPVHILSDGIETVTVTIRGYSYTTKVLSGRNNELMEILSASPAQKNRVTKVAAPMPGLLKQVIVQEGASVRKGETLFILEAMKMENSIKTPVTGIVRNVTPHEGSAIEKGVLLCVVEPTA
ncbi:MAG: biotin/lipoyl-binding protein [Ignavibacteria bacterium]|nr:biotin/lipoyl-binding protein [Ignavibacteria bacterium]